MGAATALLHGHRDPSIAAMVLDSPFSRLSELANEIVYFYSKAPAFITQMVLKFLRKSI